jgi:predicted RecA/RadA family phage recombinase
MKNYVQPGNILTFTASETVASGQGVLQGALFGVACTSAETGEQFEAQLTGVFELPKANGALSQGAKAYWSVASRQVSGTASGNSLIGAIAEDAQDAAGLVRVRLNGTV